MHPTLAAFAVPFEKHQAGKYTCVATVLAAAVELGWLGEAISLRLRLQAPGVPQAMRQMVLGRGQ